MEVRSLEAIVRALNGANVRYIIVGGIAVNAHGYERLTVDVDLVIGLETANVKSAFEALRAIDYHPSVPITPDQFADSEIRESFRRDKGMVVLKFWSDEHMRTPLDVFVYDPFDFEMEYAAAKREAIRENLHAPVLRYQTLLEMKRSAGRDKDLLDIENLMKLDPYR